jgi:hypothetical protein
MGSLFPIRLLDEDDKEDDKTNDDNGIDDSADPKHGSPSPAGLSQPLASP